jgi:hypothetical protein
MPYTAEKPDNAPAISDVRERVPNWGVDLDPAVRPAVPKERFVAGSTGAHWDFPEQQPETYPRERTPEHKFLTPVFGTAQPPRGLSGAIRRYAYTFSEGRLTHWLLLVGADRVDVLENRVMALLSGRPDNPIAEMGLMAEVKRHGWDARVGQDRADLKHQPLDVVMNLWPLFAGAVAVYAAGQAISTRRTPRSRGRRVRQVRRRV